MAQDTTPALVLYVGNGVQTDFEVPFDKGSFGEIKVAFVRRGLTDYTYDPDTYNVKGYLYAWNGGVYTKTETPDTDTPLYDKDGVATGDTWEDTMYREPKNDIFTRAYIEWTGEPLTSNDVICIVRETQKDQPYSYPNNQKHIERALDNLSRQIQELQLTADNALKVDPSWNYTLDDENKMDPIAWLQTIVRSKGKTLRELRIDNDYIEYTTDDPDSATKTWNVIAGVKTGNAGVVSHIRETKIWDEEAQVYIPYLEYSVDGGNTWQPAGRSASEMEALYVKKAGDTMTGELIMQYSGGSGGFIKSLGMDLTLGYRMSGQDKHVIALDNRGVIPSANNVFSLGGAARNWKTVYTKALNNGHDISVPVTESDDTLALKSEVDLAANSGSQLRDKGVWYAKMDAATTPPSSAGVEGRNYADFTQVDGNGDPIIVIYTYTSGTWTQTETITPPAAYNGYLPITSKFWDIQEQTGQQGGLVLWSYSAKTFTPYPRIISTDGIAITNSTFSNGSLTNVITTMPDSPVAKTVTNKQYVDAAITNALAGYDTPEVFDWKWRDATTSRTTWALSDGNWKTGATALAHLIADYESTKLYAWEKSGSYVYTKTPNEGVHDGDNVYDATGTVIDTVAWHSLGPSIHTTTGDTTYVRDDAADINLSQTETIAGITITYYLADDGHKIILPDQETNANAIYTATGTAWYYILDTVNNQFKLPRVNPDVEKIKVSVPVNFASTDTIDTTSTQTPTRWTLSDGSGHPTGSSNIAYSNNSGNSIAGASQSTNYGELTISNAYADISNGVGYYTGKQYLYFYVG